MEVSSFARCETALLLQAAYCDYQIGAFENFQQLVEDTLIVLRPGPKVFFQYELRFVNCLKSQLLIGHHFLPIKIVDQSPLLTHQTTLSGQKKEREIKPILGIIPAVFNYSINFCFNVEALSAQSRRLPSSTPLRTSTHIWRLLNSALRVSNLKYVLGP
jgi:hypothetical protein